MKARDAATALLVAATAASAAYQAVSVLMARRWQTTSPLGEEESAELLAVSVLKPLRGAEPHLEESLASFFAQDHPEAELLFGVAEPDDPAAEPVRALMRQFPQVQARIVQTRTDLGPNRKVCNLHGLATAARYDLLLVSDSDMRVPAGYLRRVAAPFHHPEVGMVTAPYRGAAAEGVVSALEALGIAASFMPGVFVAVAGDVPFASGATLALRRETLARIGGFEGLVDDLADDYQMGKRVADLGLRIHLSSVVVDSVLGRRSFRESWARRLRWARTVRACRPWGHLGSGLTHTTAWALGTIAWAGMGLPRWEPAVGGPADGVPAVAGPAVETAPRKAGSPPARTRFGVRAGGLPAVPARDFSRRVHVRRLLRGIATAAFAVRVLAAWRVAVVTLDSKAARRWFALLPISDLVETALWVCSLFGRTVLWRGQRYRLTEGGRIERDE
jgi:ceramide glucosyltransferase